MDETTYLQHYRVCTDEQGTPEQVSRSGAAINYKAVDTRSGEPVMLQLIPLAAIDPGTREQFEQCAEAVQKLDHVNIAGVREVGTEHERFVFVSEYLQGETADSWIIAHGPLAPDAALQVALQVVRAIAAAAFYGLTHRAIQPANLMIVPGAAPERGWPFVKLLNFGVAGVELHSASGEARELAPALPPQFASPEQLRGGEIDFRSEMYSLGATMCFLLAGAVPLAAGGASVRARLRSLPELRRAPRPLRKLLAQMLHENPEMRPQDPVAFEKEIQKALGIAQSRPPVVRALTPLAPVLPEPPPEGPTPLSQVGRGVLAFAALLLIGGIAAAFFYPNVLPWRHRTGDIGKPVGVPERSTSSTAQASNALPAVANAPVPVAPLPSAGSNPDAPAQKPSPSNQSPVAASVASEPTTAGSSSALVAAQQHSAPITQEPEQTTVSHAVKSAPATEAAAVASASSESSVPARKSDAAPPSEGRGTQLNSGQTAAAAESEQAMESSGEKVTRATVERSDRTKKKSRISKARASRRSTINPALAAEEDEAIRHAGQVRANFVGATGDGRLMLRLPSGEIVTVKPRPGDDNFPAARRPIRQDEYLFREEQPPSPDDQPRD
ncbi:MAG: serine/threonine protein kinase [Chthoniobacterales bacterium]